MSTSTVSFFLGYSNKPINHKSSYHHLSGLCSGSSTDMESELDDFADKYAQIDADEYNTIGSIPTARYLSKPINISSNKPKTSHHIPITPPSDPSSLSSTNNLSVPHISLKSIAQLSKAYSLPPSPPVSTHEPLSNDIHPNKLMTSSSPINPSNLLESPLFYEDSVPVLPKPAPSNSLIEINLEPVSPLWLCSDSFADDEDMGDLDLDDEDSDGAEDDDSVSPEFLVGHEHEIISHLNLEHHPSIVDKFRPRPLLADSERPFIPSIPVYETVHDLLAMSYPFLTPGTSEYNWHVERLSRNRTKLRKLSDSIECYDQVRRKRLVSEMSSSLSSGGSSCGSDGGSSRSLSVMEDKRFRARR